jgi:hypothetical protein
VSRDGVDTLFSLSVRLVYDKEKTKMFYTVKNSKEVKDKELEFTLTKAEDNLYVFENPFRDFPSIMQYRLFGDTAIEVTERGFENNKEQVWKYTVRKID